MDHLEEELSLPIVQIQDRRILSGRMQKGQTCLICEGMYGEKEKAAKAVEYKHMTFYEAANLAKEAEVGEMWLTHYSPSLRHPEEYMDEVRAIFPHAIAGKDRMTTELDSRNKQSSREKEKYGYREKGYINTGN